MTDQIRIEFDSAEVLAAFAALQDRAEDMTDLMPELSALFAASLLCDSRNVSLPSDRA